MGEAKSTDADRLRAAAEVMRRLGRYTTGHCRKCSCPKVAHLDDVNDEDGAPINCTGPWCWDSAPSRACRGYVPDWRYDNTADGYTIADKLDRTADDLDGGGPADTTKGPRG